MSHLSTSGARISCVQLTRSIALACVSSEAMVCEPKAVMLSIEEYKRIVNILEEEEAVASVLRSKKHAESGKAKLLKSLKDI